MMGCGAAKAAATAPAPEDSPTSVEPIQPVPKPVAFDIPLDEKEQSIIKKHPPRRLQRLEEQLPNLISPEEIEEKQVKAEERRQEILQERIKNSQKTQQRILKDMKAERENEESQNIPNGVDSSEEKTEEETAS